MYSDPRVEQVIDEIQKSGWDSTILDSKPEWWADRILKLKSTWSPTKAHAYLTILVDPQYPDLNSRKAEQGIWAVSISSTIPNSREDCKDFWALKQVVKSLPELIDHLNAIRKTKTQQALARMRLSAFCQFHLNFTAPPAILRASSLLASFVLLDFIFQNAVLRRCRCRCWLAELS